MLGLGRGLEDQVHSKSLLTTLELCRNIKLVVLTCQLEQRYDVHAVL